MEARKTQDMDAAMKAILTKLRDRSAASSVGQAASEEKAEYECSDCKDKGIIVYRIHQDTERQLRKEHKTMESLDPDQMVREEDYLAGKVCLPDKAPRMEDDIFQAMRVCETEKDRPAYEGQRHHGGIRKAPFWKLH